MPANHDMEELWQTISIFMAIARIKSWNSNIATAITNSTTAATSISTMVIHKPVAMGTTAISTAATTISIATASGSILKVMHLNFL